MSYAAVLRKNKLTALCHAQRGEAQQDYYHLRLKLPVARLPRNPKRT
jgi:hypothetical protein